MNVIWLDSAQKQLEESIVYISGDSSKAIAENYVADLFERANKILEFPEAGMIYSNMGRKIIRRLIIDKTKSVFYRIEKDNILILTIRGNRTDWKK